MDAPYDLAVVGAGLTALSALRAGIATGPTVVIEYRDTPGGFLSAALPAAGFEAERELLSSFKLPADVTLRCDATAVGLLSASRHGESHTLLVRRKEGTQEVGARAVLIACGGLEATRESAQIPGTRPVGVMTPALAHELLGRGYLPGRSAVVYGASRYAAATARRLARAGLSVTLVPPTGVVSPTSGDGALSEQEKTTTDGTRGDWLEAGAPRATDGDRHANGSDYGMMIAAPAELVAVGGSPRLDRVTLRRDGSIVDLAADMLVYAAGMVANTHWLTGSGVETGANGAVLVDASYRTNIPRVYAAGTVVAPSLDHTGSIAMGKEVAGILAGVTP